MHKLRNEISVNFVHCSIITQAKLWNMSSINIEIINEEFQNVQSEYRIDVFLIKISMHKQFPSYKRFKVKGDFSRSKLLRCN